MERIHFIGIGGYGMSGLARVFLSLGHPVTGSDMRLTERVRSLRQLGAVISIGHREENLDGAEMVVYSTDVPDDNPELAAARGRKLPVFHRSEILARLINSGRGIAVTGTHGKTTITTMIGLILIGAGADPTVVVGAEVEALGGNARLGRGEHVVAEADESDASFLRYRPEIAVVSNMEPEHLDHYGGDFERVVEAYGQFLAGTKPGGLCLLGGDAPQLRQLGETYGGRRLYYGLDCANDLVAEALRSEEGVSRYRVRLAGRPLGEVKLRVPGRHNVVNSLAAIGVALEIGFDFGVCQRVLEQFAGAKRRFEVMACTCGIRVVDDYAHHPSEIGATLQAARELEPLRLIAVFQPQRYVRTHLLLHDFAKAFGDADQVILADIYSPPGEKPIPGVSSAKLAELIVNQGQDVVHIARNDDITAYLQTIVRPGDTVVTMGAGDIWSVAAALAERLEDGGGRLKLGVGS